MKVGEQFLKYVLCFIFVTNMLDASLTLHWVFNGIAYEANPLMAFLISYSPLLFWFIKVFVVYIASLGLWVNRHRRWVQWAAFGVAIVYGWVLGIHMDAIHIWKI
tara:strand:+ start:7164 stop:7478 length:315 start_codon:yes stop_codon:yes gene_type:complete